MFHRRIHILTSLFLALSLVLTVASPALAEVNPNESQIQVVQAVVQIYDPQENEFVDHEPLTQHPVLEGDLRVTDPAENDYGMTYPALEVVGEETDSAFTVNGSVDMEKDRSGSLWVVDGNATAAKVTVEINGDVSGEQVAKYPGGNTGEYNAMVSTVSGMSMVEGQIDMTVNGNVTAMVDGTEGYAGANAVNAGASAYSTSTTMHITGDVVAESKGKTESENQDESWTSAVTAVADNTGSVKVAVDGKAKASSSETTWVAQAVNAVSSNDESPEESGETEETTEENEETDPEGAASKDAEPESNGTAGSDPAAPEVKDADPENGDSADSDPTVPEVKDADPAAANPEITDSENTEPEETDPETADPETAAGVAAEPEKKSPEDSEQETAAQQDAAPAPTETAETEDRYPEGTRTEVTVGKGAEGQVLAAAFRNGTTEVTILEGGVVSESGLDTSGSVLPHAGAVIGFGRDEGDAVLDITGNVVASDSESHPGNVVGAELKAVDNGTVTADFDGNITAVADDPVENIGVNVQALNMNSSSGAVEANVTGDVWALASSAGEGRADAAALSAQAVTSENGGSGAVTLTVDGKLESDAVNTDGIAEAMGISAAATGAGNSVEIDVKGDVLAHAAATEQDVTVQFGTRAVYAETMDGGSVKITVGGKAAAEAPEDLSMNKAVDACAYGDGSVTEVLVGSGAESSVVALSSTGGKTAVTVQDGGITAGMVGVEASAYSSAVEVTVTGDITVHETAIDPGEAYGMSLSSDEGGSVKAAVTGDIVAVAESGDAVALAAGNAGGTVEAAVVGNLVASGAENNYGVVVYTAEGQKTDILVDGTVRAEDAAVVLVAPETQLGENVTLTVWELVPNDQGAVVAHKENNQSTEITEDTAAEKAVQYIIRVQTGQEDIISAAGTEDYNGYKIAREGDTVTLLLNVPEGFEVTGAYGDVGQGVLLARDAEGRYFLTVPRGGAVELSVTLSIISGDGFFPDADAETPVAESRPVIIEASVITLLKVKDQAGKAEIAFRSDRTYTVSYEDGSSEKGTWRTENGTVVLVNDTDPAGTPMPLVFNAETQKYDLTFRPSADSAEAIVFELAAEEVEKLR